MQIFSRLKSIKGVLSMFSGTSKKPNKRISVPNSVVWTRFVIRLSLLGLMLFVMFWWSVECYQPECFDVWSVRMENLPDNVWIMLFTVILSWGATEFALKKADATMFDTSLPDIPVSDINEEEIDYLSMDAPDLDGRFTNLGNDDPLLMEPMEPNEEIENWKDQGVG